MARAHVSEVREILQDSNLDEGFVSRMITAANLLVTKAFEGDTTTSAEILHQIEKWFAAHIIASTPAGRTTVEEKIGDAGVKFAGRFGAKLDATPYGQMVQVLDPEGRMANLGKRPVKITAIKQFED